MRRDNKTVRIVIAVLLGSAVNGLFGGLNSWFALPLFLDTTFTIIIAAMYGWIPGAITGLLSNVFVDLFLGFEGYALSFAPINILSGVLVGLLRKYGRFETVQDGVLALAYLTVLNSVLGAFISNIVFSGFNYEPIDLVVTSLVLTGQNMWTAAFLSRIPVNLLDKAPGVFAALYLVRRYRVYVSRGNGKGAEPT